MSWLTPILFATLAATALAIGAVTELRQSREPFVVEPRFCVGGGEACAQIPVPC